MSKAEELESLMAVLSIKEQRIKELESQVGSIREQVLNTEYLMRTREREGGTGAVWRVLCISLAKRPPRDSMRVDAHGREH